MHSVPQMFFLANVSLLSSGSSDIQNQALFELQTILPTIDVKIPFF
jgi:hypothetical protein